MAEVELNSIVARYGDFVAVDDVSLTIGAGKFVTLLGPSGCGKTSTLRIVAGLMRPQSGTVAFNGRDVTRLSSSKRNIGMVFQSLALFPHLSVAENVAFGLKMKKTPAADIDGQVKRMLEIVRLGHLASRYPAQMSGGQQQRVALARALAITPSILILDEPFGALDRKLREAMQIELNALTRELGITALFVTHDQEEALMLSDAIAVMNKGRIEQIGTPSDIYRSPQTRFVADFMGVTNFLKAEVVDADATTARVRVGPALLGAQPRHGLTPGQAVTVAVRPEKILLESPTKPEAGLDGRIVQVTYHGHLSRYLVELVHGDRLVVLQSEEAARGTWTVGSRVSTRWLAADSQVFLE